MLPEIAFTNPNIVGLLLNKQWQLQAAHAQQLKPKTLCMRLPLALLGDEPILGDGFQMLAQTGGQVQKTQAIGRCPDNSQQYRIYPEKDKPRFYNYLVIQQAEQFTLLGFTSCQRFSGYFELTFAGENSYVEAFIDGESIQVEANEPLEQLVVLHHRNLAELYACYAELIRVNHPARAQVNAPAPIGWCSWYAYYAEVTEQHIRDNLETMPQISPEIEWLLLDDGYQAFMGDWLSPSSRFENGVAALIAEIKAKGKKPAIWLAPFIAEPSSHLFQAHPDWFVRGSDGAPLKAEDITYGGWRCTPWYLLDFSNPAVCAHITSVVKVMREEWGVELFKLDANYWGTLPGQRFQANITGVEAYRMGMQAICDGVGDGWILGCNAPMWPSLGLVDAMRVSDDVERHPHRYQQIAKESFARSWQHRRLWQIDPDCIALTPLNHQNIAPRYQTFHRNALFASGGMMLSGDPLPERTEFADTSLQRLFARQKLTQNSAQFHDLSHSYATLLLDDGRVAHCLFNFGDSPISIELTAAQAVNWSDYWSGELLSQQPCQAIQVELQDWLDSRIIIAG